MACDRCPSCGAHAGDTNFDRSLCACGSMHDYCNGCGSAYDCPLDKVGGAAPVPSSSEIRIEPGAACRCFPANPRCPGEVACGWERWEDVRDGGYPGYLRLLNELRSLHIAKSGGYGTADDPMANYTAISVMTGQPRYLYPVHRSIEKLARALSLHAQGRVGELEEEFLDTASSLLCAAAMLREDV